MLRNYLVTAYRTLLRNKGYAFLNIAGLALGLTGSLLIFQVIKFHLSFDTYHTRAGRTYQMLSHFLTGGDGQPTDAVTPPLGAALRADFPFLEAVTTVLGQRDRLITIERNGSQQKFNEERAVCYTDTGYFRVFDYQWLSGNTNTALQRPNTVVLTRKLAEKYFGTTDVLGRAIRMNNDLDLTVTGVLENIPDNTDRRHEFFISWATLDRYNNPRSIGGPGTKEWGWTSSRVACFVVAKDPADMTRLSRAMPSFRRKYLGDDAKDINYLSVPYSKVHFDKQYHGVISKTQLYVLGLVGLFLIVTACINFVNLATAQALKRSREIGVRKVVGGTRPQLFGQFLAETAVITFLSIVLAVGFTELVLDPLNTYLSSRANFNLMGGTFWDFPMILFLTAVFVVVTLLSGAYPGLVLTGFRPVSALKGKISTQQIGGMPVRRGLVVMQFVITQVLLISAIVVTRQMNFFRNSDLGYTASSVVMLPVPDRSVSLSLIRNELSRVPGVESVTLCTHAPTASMLNQTSSHRFGNRTEDEKWEVAVKPADARYLSTFHISLLAGRNFPDTDSLRGYLVNETYVRKLGLKPADVIGQRFRLWGESAPIYGVVKDFHNQSLDNPIEPVVIYASPSEFTSAALRVKTGQLTETLASAQAAWEKLFPDYLYRQTFLDDQIAQLYETEDLILQLVRLFTGLAVLIGCVGLYGLVSFMAAQKTKEIGVRKVLGASLWQILGLFGGEFLRLMLLAFVVAAPLGGWAMSAWLSEFTFRIPMEWSVFAVSVALTGLIVLLTVGWKAFQAASLNPAKSLKTE
ncbi:MAG: ABC transporter permease [Siphonobacter aquaeclarae]|nr:ABC transporter permease [Siphonobacter aquaeclarae]